MKLVFSVITLGLAMLFPLRGQEANPDREKLRQIAQRVEQGETAALLETANLDPRVAAQYLFHKYLWYKSRRHTPEYAMAQEALSKVKGLAEYSDRRLEEIKSDLTPGEIRKTSDTSSVSDIFQILGFARTEEAARVCAKWLFDDAKIYLGDDVGYILFDHSAQVALGHMRLADSPVPKELNPYHYQREHLEKWQQWAIAKGYVKAPVASVAVPTEATPPAKSVPETPRPSAVLDTANAPIPVSAPVERKGNLSLLTAFGGVALLLTLVLVWRRFRK